MYWSVYYHKTTRGVENLLISILQRAKDLILEKKEVYHDAVFEKVFKGEGLSPTDMAEFDDVTLQSHLRTWRHSSDSILADLCRRYFDRVLFKGETLTGEQLIAITQKMEKIEGALKGLDLNPSYYYRVDYANVYPYAPGFSEDEGRVDVVNVGKDNQVKSIREITTESRVIRLLRDEHKEGFRVHSTEEGLRAIMDVIED
jgi:HD superfamily phosphohydrolase